MNDFISHPLRDIHYRSLMESRFQMRLSNGFPNAKTIFSPDFFMRRFSPARPPDEKDTRFSKQRRNPMAFRTWKPDS